MERQLLGLYIALVAAAVAAGPWAACEAQQPQQQPQGRPSAAAGEQRLQSWPRKQQRQPGGGGGGSPARPAAEDAPAPSRNGQGAVSAVPPRAASYRDATDASEAVQPLPAAAQGFHHEPFNASARARRVQDDKKLAKLFYQKLGGASFGGIGIGGGLVEEDRRGRVPTSAAAAASHGRHFAGFSEYMAVDALGDQSESYGRGGVGGGGGVAGDQGVSDEDLTFGSDFWPPATGEGRAQAAAGASRDEAGIEQSAATSACPNCQLMREEALAFRIEAIKQDILSKLQLERPPNVTRRQRDPRIPKHLLFRDGLDDDADDAETGDVLDDEFATIERVFRFAEKVPDEKLVQSASPDTLYFDMPKQVLGAKIRRAKLGVYAHCSDDAGRAVVTVKVYDAAAGPGSTRELLTSQKLSVDRKGRWVHLDVTPLVEAWAVDPEANFGVVAVAESPSGPGAVRLSGVADEEERKAFLEIHMGGPPAGRRKRDLGLECTESSAEERCCRYPFTVDFDEFGPSFDFIITPRRYPANYCAGQCPPAFLPMHTNTQLTHVSRRLPANSRQPCCTPRKMEGVFMVYVDDYGTYMQGVLPGMTIKSCGCS